MKCIKYTLDLFWLVGPMLESHCHTHAVVCLLGEERTLKLQKKHVLATAQIKGFKHARPHDGFSI